MAHLIAGIDEAGRGPWAGPVVAAAVILPNNKAVPDYLTDSKALSAKKRDVLYAWIMEHAIVGVGYAEAEEIDRINILQATLQAMLRAVKALSQKPDHVMIDGRDCITGDFTCESIVKGDLLIPAISAASIIAKVTRDRLMAGYALDYPHYGFERNQGYGTILHQKGLQLQGVCPIHRMSYKPIKAYLDRQ